MKDLGSCISLTSGVVLVYVIVSTLPVAFPIVFWLFLLCQGLLIWMVIRILKDKRPVSAKTFDTHFYEDSSYRRNN